MRTAIGWRYELVYPQSWNGTWRIRRTPAESHVEWEHSVTAKAMFKSWPQTLRGHGEEAKKNKSEDDGVMDQQMM